MRVSFVLPLPVRVASVAALLTLAGCSPDRSCESPNKFEEKTSVGFRIRSCMNAGLPDGPASTWSEDGQLVFEGQLEYGGPGAHSSAPRGILKWWHPDGGLRAEIGFSADPFGHRQDAGLPAWARQGSLGRLLMRLESIWKSGSREKAELRPKEKPSTIRIIQTDDDRTLANSGLGPRIPDGPAKFNRQDGSRLFSVRYRDGRAEGHWRAWHSNGEKAFEGEFREGLQEGVWRYWYPDGKPGARAEYEQGVPKGEWKAWKRDGTLALEIRFSRDEPEILEAGAASGPAESNGAAGMIPLQADDATWPAPSLAFATWDDAICRIELERAARLFGEVFTEFREAAGSKSPFPRVDRIFDLIWAGLLDKGMDESGIQ